MMMAMNGGRGAAFAAGPGFDRIGAPPFREAANRDPIEAMKVRWLPAPSMRRPRTY
jgi:hypothetical protein